MMYTELYSFEGTSATDAGKRAFYALFLLHNAVYSYNVLPIQGDRKKISRCSSSWGM